MPPKVKLRQGVDFEAFRCIGAACEDTCCGDWGVSIDRQTYEKYRTCGDPEMRRLFRQLVTISPTQGNDEDYARIALTENRCPFLTEGWCSIQQKLGESYLSNTCSSYPRTVVSIDGTMERSLHLSCPEAARLVLLNAGRYEWQEGIAEVDGGELDGKVKAESIPALNSLRANREGNPYPYFQEMRELILEMLQSCARPRWQRLALLARVVEEIGKIIDGSGTADEQAFETAELIARTRGELQPEGWRFEPVDGKRPLVQIEAVLELIVARIGSDFTTRRFLECYREFMQGLSWDADTTMEELNARYQEARVQHYEPFMSRHEYLLDNFLVHYVIRTVFPYGYRDSGQLRITYAAGGVQRQYMLLAAHYAVLQTVLIGMAGYHGQDFGKEHVVKLVQAHAKAFLHSSSYPEKAIQVLSSHGIRSPLEALVLFEDGAAWSDSRRTN
jgi:lysine-N-methylase